MRGETVSQCVHRNAFLDASLAAELLQNLPRRGHVIGLVGRLAGKQQGLGAILEPILPQQLQEHGREPCVTILLPLP